MAADPMVAGAAASAPPLAPRGSGDGYAAAAPSADGAGSFCRAHPDPPLAPRRRACARRRRG